MKEKIKGINKSMSRLRRITFAFLPMMTIQWLCVYSTPNPITIACALFVSDLGIEQLFQQHQAEKEHIAFMEKINNG